MATDFNKPVTTDNYADILETLRDNITTAQTLLDDLAGVSNIPTGAIKFESTAKKFQRYNGTSMVDQVLSPAGGGTGITNWDAATTAEVEAGTAGKFPDAEKVKDAVSKFGSNMITVNTAPVFSLDLNVAVSGAIDGFYRVENSSGVDGTIHVLAGRPSRSMIFIHAYSTNALNTYGLVVSSSGVLTVEKLNINTGAGTSSLIGDISFTNVYKIS